MALRSTLYKADLDISDIDRGYYAKHTLTLALHPSETEQRLMVRLLAFALYADAELEFGRGLSAEDEPDLWQRDPTGRIVRWIEVGLPDARAVRKACGRADQVVVIAYGERKMAPWWRECEAELQRCRNLRVLQVTDAESEVLSRLAARAMQLGATVQEGGIWLASADHSVECEPRVLFAPSDE